MNILSVVKNIGLTDKEAKVYLACLELGSAAASDIAELAGINRVTTYDILEKLIAKGYAHFLNKNGTRYFGATNPQNIAHEMHRKTLELKKALPELKRLRGEAVHPKVRYFEGLEGIKALYADTLNAKTEICNYSNSKEIRDHWENYDEEYVMERVKRKIFLRGISPEDEHGQWVQQHDAENFREIRLVPSGEISFTNEINIYDNKVAIASFTDVPLIGMVIVSAEIANTQRAIFKMSWDFAAWHGKKHGHAMSLRGAKRRSNLQSG